MIGRIARGALALLLPLIAAAPVAASHTADGRVVMVVAGNLSIRDIADPALPQFSSMMRNGSAALVNTRTGRPNRLIEPVAGPGMEPGCLSLGAGAMAIGGAEARRAMDADDDSSGIPARDAYAFRTGRESSKAEVLHIEIARIQRANLAASYRAVPGALGSVLRQAGIRTAIIGNSDIPGEPHREAAACAMDSMGIVDVGNVGSPDLLIHDPRSPYGIRANPATLLRELDRALARCRFIVVDFGDTFRADGYAELCTDERALAARRDAVRRLDGLLGRISERLDFAKDTMMVISPSPRVFTDLDEERLTPLLIRGKAYPAGPLTSPSTRTRGLVTISDIAPTVISLLGIVPPPDLTGRPIQGAGGDGLRDLLLNLNLDASLQGQRQAAMRGASVAQSAVVVLATLTLLFATSPVLRRFAAWTALVPAVLPLVMLYLPLIYNGGLAGAAAWLIALTPLLVLVCAVAFHSPVRSLAWLCGALVVSLVIDIARGAPLISSCIAGYSMIEGARYYGIGNELAGAMTAASMVGLGLMLSGGRLRMGRPGVLVALALGVVFVAIGGSGLGANAGGAASAAPAFAVMLLARRGWRPSARGFLLIAVMSVIVVAGLFAFDAARGGGSQSHIGRVADVAAAEGSMGILAIAQRKLALNFMLVSTSVWSRLLGLSLVGSIALYWQGRGKLGWKLLDRETAGAALGCCVATVLTFALNDSGVLSAAAAAVFLWMLLAVRSHEVGARKQ